VLVAVCLPQNTVMVGIIHHQSRANSGILSSVVNAVIQYVIRAFMIQQVNIRQEIMNKAPQRREVRKPKTASWKGYRYRCFICGRKPTRRFLKAPGFCGRYECLDRYREMLKELGI
jgi:hypothetical protein